MLNRERSGNASDLSLAIDRRKVGAPAPVQNGTSSGTAPPWTRPVILASLRRRCPGFGRTQYHNALVLARQLLESVEPVIEPYSAGVSLSSSDETLVRKQ
jgi:hypothetical protein